MKVEFWERRKFFDEYGNRTNEQLANLPFRGMRVTCPCCGYPTIAGDSYEICYLCSWENDGQDDAHADEVWGGPNHGYSLTEARLNFERFLVMYPPAEDTRVGGADSPRVKEIKQAIVDAFDEMMREPTQEELNSLWHTIEDNEKALRQELKRRIFGPLYEATPCPYCGAALRTREAKQCRKCGTDWHDPNNVTKLT